MDRGRPRKIRRMFWGLGTAGLVVMMAVLFIPRPPSNPQLNPETVPPTNPPTNPPPELPLFQLDLICPQENATIIFPPGTHNYLMVNFTQANLTQVNLIINKINYGSVTAGVPIDLTYNATLDGNVSLELQGYYQGEKVIATGHNCTFGKIDSYTLTDVLDSGNLSVPAQRLNRFLLDLS